MVKPDGVQRNLTGEIIRRFEAKGYYLRYPLHHQALLAERRISAAVSFEALLMTELPILAAGQAGPVSVQAAQEQQQI